MLMFDDDQAWWHGRPQSYGSPVASRGLPLPPVASRGLPWRSSDPAPVIPHGCLVTTTDYSGQVTQDRPHRTDYSGQVTQDR